MSDVFLEDKELYSFRNLLKFVEESFKKYMSTTEAGTKEDREKEASKKELLRASANCCYAGNENDKNLVKQFILRVITRNLMVFLENYPDTFKIDSDTIYHVFPWAESYKLPTHIKFLGLIYFWKDTLGGNAFFDIVTRYNLDSIRKIPTVQGDEKETVGMYIDDVDIDAIFEGDGILFSYDLALDVLVQMLYEEFKGNGCIDELLYQSVDDIGVGISGLPDEIEPWHLRGRRVNKAYDGAWIKYRGKLIHVKFLSFHTFVNLKRVVRQLVQYDIQGAFSEKEGRKLGYGKDGSRRTAAISPFGENSAGWVRKFTAKEMTNRQLVTFIERGGQINGWENLLRVERSLVIGGATIPICGPQASGKTTKLEAISEYIQNWYAIRMIESEFEARIRWRYPEKNIFTMQTTIISPEDAYEFSLRTSGDIYIVSEVRSDKMMVNITRTANRGGRSVIFTYHPNKPRATIIEIANSLIREKLYTSLKDAMYTTLDVIKCCIHIELDQERGCRYYNIYEFQPIQVQLSEKFKELTGSDRSSEFLHTTFNFFEKMVGDEYFEVVPIITYDRFKDGYVFHNSISEAFYNELIMKSGLFSEKEEITKVFRPLQYLTRYIEKQGRNVKSEKQFMELAERLNLNTSLLDYGDFVKQGV